MLIIRWSITGTFRFPPNDLTRHKRGTHLVSTGTAKSERTIFDIAFCSSGHTAQTLRAELVNRWEKTRISTDARADLTDLLPVLGSHEWNRIAVLCAILGGGFADVFCPHLPAQSWSKDLPGSGRINRVTGGRDTSPSRFFSS